MKQSEEIQRINKSLINKSCFWMGLIGASLVLAFLDLWSPKGQLGALVLGLAYQNILFIIHIRKLNKLK